MLSGTVDPNFAEVAAALGRQLASTPKNGAAVCVYHRGKPVVDIWGGYRNLAREPWQPDTIAASFSTSKGVTATLLHVLMEKSGTSYDDPIAKYWPEFGARGKRHLTIRHALCHEAGLYRVRDMVSEPSELLDWNHMLEVIAGAQPAHAPGAEHGYHAMTFGWIIGGLIEKLSDRSFADALSDELTGPLALDGAYVGVPENQLPRRAELAQGEVAVRNNERPEWLRTLGDWWERGLSVVGVDMSEFRAAMSPTEEPIDWNALETVRATIPAANGHFTARSLARMYSMIAQGGVQDDVRLLAPDRTREMGVVQNTGRDRVLFIPMKWRLGYHRCFAIPMRCPNAFGHFGYGGSGAFCDPTRQLGVAMIVNSGSGTPTGDGRMAAIARAALKSADRVMADV